MVERILYICAHPDDCELMFGGMISHFVKRNIDVFVIIVTDGTKWVRNENLSYEDIREHREMEASEASNILGVKKCKFLKYVDGEIDRFEISDALLDAIREFNPNIIFTHSEEEKHSDHKEVSRCVKRLCNQLSEPAPILNDFWKSSFPPVTDFHSLYTYATISEINQESVCFVPLDREDVENKIKAILCYKSQFNLESKNKIYDKVMTEAKFWGNLCGMEYAEVCNSVRTIYYNLSSII